MHWPSLEEEKPTFAVGDRIRMNYDGEKGTIQYIHPGTLIAYGVLWDKPNRWECMLLLREGDLEQIAAKAVSINDEAQ